MVAPKAIEPSPSLKALVDLPLRHTLEPGFENDIRVLAQRMRALASDGDWAPVYVDAVRCVEAMVKDADVRIEELQRRAVGMDDPMELKQRLAQAPRRDADKTRGEVRAALQRVAREWTERTKRQLEHVTSQCLDAASTNAQLDERPDAHGLALAVDVTWWAQFGGYVHRCAEEWTRNAVTGAESALASAVASSAAPLVAPTGTPVTTPAALPPPENELALPATDVPRRVLEIPSTGHALMNYVRSNIMAVGIFGTVVTVLVALGGKLAGGSGEAGNSMLVRGGLILAVLPFSIVLGIRAARRQRAKLHDQGLAAHKQAVLQHVKTALDKVLERHRRGLERWMTARQEQWQGEVDRYWEKNVESRFADSDAKAVEAVRDLKVTQAKLGEEIAAVRAFRGQLTQSLLFELRKRMHELRAT